MKNAIFLINHQLFIIILPVFIGYGVAMEPICESELSPLQVIPLCPTSEEPTDILPPGAVRYNGSEDRFYSDDRGESASQFFDKLEGVYCSVKKEKTLASL